MRMWSGRAFQVAGPARENARSPNCLHGHTCDWQSDLVSVVGPRSELERAQLLVERIELHVDRTRTLVDGQPLTCLLLQPFKGLFSSTTQVSRYQKGKTNLDFTGARDCEWQWHQLGHMQVCTSLKTDNDASAPPLCFYRPDALPAAQPTASKH